MILHILGHDGRFETATTANGGTDGTRRHRGRRWSRGQSEVVGVALLIGFVVLAVSLLFIYGTAAMGEQTRTVAVSHAERGFDQFDTRTSRVALGDDSVQEVDFGLVDNQGHLHSNDDGWIRVQVTPEREAATEVTNASLGTVVYRRDETTVAYQGGGVFRTDGEGVTMLSRPEFHYNGETLTVPIVGVDGDPGLSDRVRVTKNGTAVRVFPDPSRDLTNKLRSGTVTVTVQSTYYEAWGRYFEANTNGVVTYDDPAEQVTVTFFALPDIRALDVGIIATSSAGELNVAGTGAYVNSYDSSAGDYEATKSANGAIRSAGDVSTTGNALIDGDVSAGGTVVVDASSQINGSVEYTVPPAPDETRVTGEVDSITGVDSVPPIDTFVAAYGDRIRADATNDATPYITDNHLSLSGSTSEIGPGDYYLHNMSLNGGETLVLNTTEGNIRIAVRDWVNVKSGTIRVVGDGSADIVVQSRDTVEVNPTGLSKREVHLNVGKGGAIDVPGENSNRLTVFGNRTFKATIAGSSGVGNRATFDGVIFAPAGTTGPSSVYVKQGDVYGLVVTGNLTAGQYGAIHYDRGLDDEITSGTSLSQIEYLHAVVHRVTVTSDR